MGMGYHEEKDGQRFCIGNAADVERWAAEGKTQSEVDSGRSIEKAAAIWLQRCQQNVDC
jgi:hypothetical protein